MSDEITVTTKTESTPTSTQEIQTNSLVRPQLIGLCAFGLGICFFLPWAHILFDNPSGFDLQKAGDEQMLLWSIPILCVITIIAGIAKQSQSFVARVTGVLPFVVLFYWYNKIGSDVMHIMAVGGYLSLIFGIALILLPTKSK